MEEMICEKSKCLGCFACYNICPKNAIEMKEDECGFIYPTIKKDICINCDLCKKICPEWNKKHREKQPLCYAAQVVDKDKMSSSSSGGIASEISEHFLKNEGIVYGVAITDDIICKHIRVDKIDNLSKLKGSKYVHSYIGNTFQNVKKDLLANKDVLFIGTPCQVAGLKQYLMKNYENLFCIDLICHGVSSQQFLKTELANYNISKIKKLTFRNKDKFYLKVQDDKNNIKEIKDSFYLKGFLNGLTYRENCYNCKFATIEREGDITLGDFWGIDENSKLYPKKGYGVSLVLINNDKAMEMFKSILDHIEYEERPLEEAIKNNAQLRNSTKMPKNYYKFIKLTKKYKFNKAFVISYPMAYVKMKVKKFLRKW